MAVKTGQRVSTQKTVGQFKNGDATAFTGTSARLAVDSECVRVYADQACYLKSGDDTVVAASGDHDVFLPATTTYDLDIGSNTHLAVIQVSSGGTLQTSEIQ